jgi:hypothetical protein
LKIKEEQNAWNYFGGHIGDDVVRFIAQMGSQSKLGLWAERRLGAGSVDFGHPAAIGPALNGRARLFLSSEEGKLLAWGCIG